MHRVGVAAAHVVRGGLFLKEPFNMIISGITNCGKTKFVLDLIELEYCHYYDYVVIF